MTTKRYLKASTRMLIILSVGYLLFVMIYSGTPREAIKIASEDIASGDLTHAKSLIEFALRNQLSFMRLELIFILLVLVKCGYDLFLMKRLPDD